MTAKIAAADADPFALQQPPVRARTLQRRPVVLIVVGIIAYLIGLIAFIPASWFIDDNENLEIGGTIWNGEAVLASTIRVEWGFAPLNSLLQLGFATNWRMTGGATDLAGSMTKRGAKFRLEHVSGQADGTLLAALAPRLPISCAFVADVRLDTLQLGGDNQSGRATLRMSPAKCSARAVPGPIIKVPALRGSIVPQGNGTSGALATIAGRQRFVELRLARNGALSIWPTANAVRLVPVLAGQRFDTQID